tara:strand:+ start:243 stop:788 length:546 start_codon:yes stop_codon:yes gene_type:complete
MLKAMIMAALLLPGAGVARAEVVERHPDGFTLRMSAPVNAGWGQAFLAVGDVPHWWNANHTYSGDAANLSLPLEPGACFCERLADGSAFEHGRVIAANARHEVRLEAPLGPLKDRATQAALTFGWNDTIGADQVLTLTYIVEGDGLGAMAGPVDQVLTDQFARWVAWAPSVHLTTRAPPSR